MKNRWGISLSKQHVCPFTGAAMPTLAVHNNINIVTLYRDDDLSEHCQPGDVALKQEDGHWMTYEVRGTGQVAPVGFPCESYDKAMELAKAATEHATQSK